MLFRSGKEMEMAAHPDDLGVAQNSEEMYVRKPSKLGDPTLEEEEEEEGTSPDSGHACSR